MNSLRQVLVVGCRMLAVMCLLSHVALAQESPIPQRAPSGQKLIMVVRVSDESKPINARRLQEIMEEGLEKSECRCEGRPQVSTISPTFFREFQQVLQMAEGPPVAGGKNGNIRITPLFAQADEKYPYSYDITLSEKGAILSEIKVAYDEKGQNTEVLTPANSDRVMETGVDANRLPVYRVLLPNKPWNYELKQEKLDSAEPVTFSEKWPVQDVHYAVALQSFTGDFENLRRVLLNQGVEKMSDPLTDIASVSDTRFVLGVIGGQFTGTTPEELNQLLDIAEQEVPNRGVEKIFVKLPLTAAEARQELEKFAHVSNREAIQKLREEAPAAPPIGPTRTGRPMLQSDAPAAWYELERLTPGQPFRGQLSLGDPQNVAALTKRFPAMYMVVIQQNGSGDRARAVWVQVPANVTEVLPANLLGQETLLIPRRSIDPDLKQEAQSSPQPAPESPAQ
jgi:hypothetical protein